MSNLLMDLGWVDFDLGVPPSCPSAQPLLPNFDQPRQNCAAIEYTQNSSQPSHEHVGHPVVSFHQDHSIPDNPHFQNLNQLVQKCTRTSKIVASKVQFFFAKTMSGKIICPGYENVR